MFKHKKLNMYYVITGIIALFPKGNRLTLSSTLVSRMNGKCKKKERIELNCENKQTRLENMVCGTTADLKGALFLHTEEPLKYTQGCWIKGKYEPNYF